MVYAESGQESIVEQLRELHAYPSPTRSILFPNPVKIPHRTIPDRTIPDAQHPERIHKESAPEENTRLLYELHTLLRLRSEDAKDLRHAVQARDDLYLTLRAMEDDRMVAAQDAQASLDRLRLDLQDEQRRRSASDKRVDALERRLDALTDGTERAKGHIDTALTSLRHDRIHLVVKPLSPLLPHRKRAAKPCESEKNYSAAPSVASTSATSSSERDEIDPVSQLHEEIERTTNMLAHALGYPLLDTQLV